MSTNYKTFFSHKNPHLQAFEETQNTYAKHDNIIFILTPKSGNVFNSRTLTAIADLTQEAWYLPYSSRVSSITNFQSTWAHGDEIIVENLVPEGQQLSPPKLKEIRKIALNEPSLINLIISPQGDVTGVDVRFQLPDENQMDAVPEVALAAQTLKQSFENKYPDIDIRLVGIIMQNQAFALSTVYDYKTLVPIIFLVIIISIALIFRTFYASLLVVFVMLTSVIIPIGIIGLAGITMNIATMISPLMIIPLAIADAIHILSNFFHEYKRDSSKIKAIEETLLINVRPVVVTSITTIIGFLSLNFSDVPPFRQLGNMVAAGVGFAMIISLFVLPALFKVMPIKPLKKSYSLKWLDKLSSWIIRYQRRILMGGGLLMVFIISFAPRNQLNDTWLDYFSPKLEYRQDSDYALEHLTGAGGVSYSLQAKGPNGISDPEYLKSLDDFSNWLRQQPEVRHVSTISDTFKRLNRTMNQDSDKFYTLPQTKELAAQYLLLYELSLGYGVDLTHQINLDKSSTLVYAHTKKLSTQEVLAFEQSVQTYQKNHMPEYMWAEGTSPDIMFANIGYTNIRAMMIGFFALFIFIGGFMMVVCRSFTYGLISLIPNTLPILAALGVWGLFVGEIGLSLSIVAGMTIGIIIDDTIHFMCKFLRAKQWYTTEASVQYAFHTVGKPLIVTSFVLFIGFLILSMSTFELNAKMGLLTAITILIALLTDFFILPVCLLKIAHTRKPPQNPHRYTK